MLAGFQVVDIERADNFLSLDHVTRVDRSLLRARSWGCRRHRFILGHRSVCVDGSRRRRADGAEG